MMTTQMEFYLTPQTRFGLAKNAVVPLETNIRPNTGVFAKWFLFSKGLDL